MRAHHIALGLTLLATAATAATVADFYGKWSRGDCAEEWVMFSENKVTQFSSRFQAVETAENPSAARRPAPAQAAKAPTPPAKAPEPPKSAAAAPAPAKAADPANPDQPRNPATARRIIDNTQPRNPATARKITEEPKPAAAPAAAPPAKAPAKSKEMVLPATFKVDGERLSVETQEQGRKPRREVYAMADKDTLVLQDTFVDGRRIPPITRDRVTYRRCK